MVLAYILALSLCAAQAMGANTVVLPDLLDDHDDDDSAVVAASFPSLPSSPARGARQSSAPLSRAKVGSTPGTPTKTPTKPIVKPSPGKSPWAHKLTPGRGAPNDRGSHVIVRTSPTEVMRRKVKMLSTAISSSDSDGSASPKRLRVESVTFDAAVKDFLTFDCERYLGMHRNLVVELEKMLAKTPRVPCEIKTLYPAENTFWQNTLVKIDPRVITKMPYRSLLGVTKDRQDGKAASVFFTGKNKHNVFDHAFSYEFLCRILTSPEIHAFKKAYAADLSAAKDGSMLISYNVIELHYPTVLQYVKSPNSPVGRTSDDEIASDLGERTSVITFSQSPEALQAAYTKATPTLMGDGSTQLFFENKFNWIFHAQHQEKIAAGLVPVQVELIIGRDFAGQPCLELEIVD